MPGSLHYRSQRGKGDSVTVYCACVLKPTQGFKRATTKNLHSTWLCGPLYTLPKRRNLLRITKLGRQSHAASEDETLSWLLGSPWRQLSITRLSNFPVHRLLRLLGPFGVANPDSLWIPRDLPSLDYRLSVVSGFLYAYSAPQHINSYIIYIHTTILCFVLLQV